MKGTGLSNFPTVQTLCKPQARKNGSGNAVRPLCVAAPPHSPKEQLASSGEFYPVRLDALSQSRVEVLFYAAKVRKGFDICKCNILSNSVLNVVSDLSGRVGAPSRGGPNERFLSASAEPAEGCGRQIFGGREHDLAA